MLSEHITRSVAEWQAKQREGTLTIDDMRQALVAIREERGIKLAAANASKATKKVSAAKTPKQSVDDLLDMFAREE